MTGTDPKPSTINLNPSFRIHETCNARVLIGGIRASVVAMRSWVLGDTRAANERRKAYDDLLRLLDGIEVDPNPTPVTFD